MLRHPGTLFSGYSYWFSRSPESAVGQLRYLHPLRVTATSHTATQPFSKHPEIPHPVVSENRE
jgi:hypothetical protein